MPDITIPNTLSDGNTILASELNQNFTAVTDVVNGNIDNDNIAAGAAIAASKLAIANILTAASTISIGVGTTGDTNPRIALDTDGHLVLGSGSAAGDVRLTRESAGVAAIRNAADSAYADLKVDNLIPATPLDTNYGGTGLTDSDLSSKDYFPVRINSDSSGFEGYDQTPSQLTVDSVNEDIAPTKNIHTIGTYGGAGTDDLTDIDAASVPVGHELTLKSDGSGNVVTVKTTGNIDTYDGNDFAIEDGYYIKLYWDGTNWKEIGRFSAATGTQVNSTEVTHTAGGTTTWAHGLGATPIWFGVKARCNSADKNYAVNECIWLSDWAYDGSGAGQTIYAEATNVKLKSASSGLVILDKSSAQYGGTPPVLSKWRFTFVAREA